MVESIIICRFGDFGYVASLRFTDKSNDCDISHFDKNKLYKMIDYKIRSVNYVP